MSLFLLSGNTNKAGRAARIAWLAVLALAAASVGAERTTTTLAADAKRASALEKYGKLPLSFIENRGQTDTRIAYYLHSPGYSLYFTESGHALRLTQGHGEGAKAHTVKVDLVGAAVRRIEGRESARGIVSYFKGPKAEWRTGIPTQASIGYVQPWPGIDLAYNGHGGKFESIYTVAPGANPSRIKLRYSGQDSLKIDDDGNLVYRTSVGEVKETAPILYQEIGGRRVFVKGRYRLLDKNTVSFQVARYNRIHALVIDPTLAYAGFIGGFGSDEGFGIAVDGDGNAYVTGVTDSTAASFPVLGGPDPTANGRADAFVAKINPAGTALVYAGYIGGSEIDWGQGIAVDSSGNAYVTGYTNSTEPSFPVVVGPDLTANGSFTFDAFVAKVNPAGTALVYSGFIGGASSDLGYGIAVDDVGNAYVTGNTAITNPAVTGFPVLGGPDLTFNGGGLDGFVTKINSAGTALVYSGFIGGSDDELGAGIAVDGNGSAYVTGSTRSTEASFPVLGGLDVIANGVSDAFVVKVSPGGAGLVYAGFIGGSDEDQGLGIAVDSGGSAFVAGVTGSAETSFPAIGGPDLSFGGVEDAFVAKVNPAGTALIYAGYIGGTEQDRGLGIDLDSAGNAYVSGHTNSSEASFPVFGGPDLIYGGARDGFVAKVNPAGTALVYSSYIGGSAADQSNGIAVDNAGKAYVTGSTNSSSSFPVFVGPDVTSNGGLEAFVAKIGLEEIIFRNGFE